MKSVLKLTRISPHILSWLFWIVLLGLIFLYYGFLLTESKKGGEGFFRHVSILWEQRDSFELTFNSMLQHLMWGRFDVSPETVGLEGFYRHGRTYAYWGIFPALIRFPL